MLYVIGKDKDRYDYILLCIYKNILKIKRKKFQKEKRIIEVYQKKGFVERYWCLVIVCVYGFYFEFIFYLIKEFFQEYLFLLCKIFGNMIFLDE